MVSQLVNKQRLYGLTWNADLPEVLNVGSHSSFRFCKRLLVCIQGGLKLYFGTSQTPVLDDKLGCKVGLQDASVDLGSTGWSLAGKFAKAL